MPSLKKTIRAVLEEISMVKKIKWRFRQRDFDKIRSKPMVDEIVSTGFHAGVFERKEEKNNFFQKFDAEIKEVFPIKTKSKLRDLLHQFHKLLMRHSPRKKNLVLIDE